MTRPPLGEPGDGNAADDDVLADLRRVVADREPPPPALAEAGRAAFRWRTVDAELAELIADSLEASVLVRAPARERVLRFQAEGVLLDVEATPAPGGRWRLVGQVDPGRAGRIEVRGSDRQVCAVDADEWGRFDAGEVPAGIISLEWLGSGAHRRVRTSWIRL